MAAIINTAEALFQATEPSVVDEYFKCYKLGLVTCVAKLLANKELFLYTLVTFRQGSELVFSLRILQFLRFLAFLLYQLVWGQWHL